MLSWIKSFVERWAGVVPAAIRDLVHWTVHALASVVYTVFGNVGAAWHFLFVTARWVERSGADFVLWIVRHVVQLVTVTIPRLAATALGYLHAAISWATSLYKLALAGLHRLEQLAAQWVKDALSWVVAHVWLPLLALAKQLRADLLKWGYYAWWLVTHPAKLAAILLDALIAAAEAAFWRIAPPAGTFALRLVLANARRFALLIESIVTAVL